MDDAQPQPERLVEEQIFELLLADIETLFPLKILMQAEKLGQYHAELLLLRDGIWNTACLLHLRIEDPHLKRAIRQRLVDVENFCAVLLHACSAGGGQLRSSVNTRRS
jgi:hypothetical protein